MMKINGDVLKIVKLYAKQNGKCPYTGLSLIPFMQQGIVNLDHIVPQVKGGTDKEDNLALVPEWVNAMKGAKSVEEFKMWLKENNLPVTE